MEGRSSPYIHSLLFQCPHCEEPLLLCVLSDERNFESIDGSSFDMQCRCGWRKKLLGLEAMRHFINHLDNGQEPEDDCRNTRILPPSVKSSRSP